jgi:replicative DNA helicase
VTAEAFTDDVAERAVLGALLIDPPVDVAAEVFALLDMDAFYRPAHQVIFDSIGKVRAEHDRIDRLLVTHDLIQRGELARAGGHGYVNDLADSVNVGSASFFAAQVAAAAQRRATWTLLTTAVQRVGNVATDLPEILEDLRAELDVIDLLAGACRQSRSGVVDGYEWLESPVARKPWSVPGLLRVADRVVITGTPGAGKSTLIRQIAGLIAAGLHPFLRTPIEPRRVLIFDCENDEEENWAYFNRLFSLTDHDGGSRTPGYFHVRHKMGGLNLGNAAHARLLLDAVTESHCDVVAVGPLYKLSAGNTNDEENARKVTWVLDTIRERTGTAMLIEAHPGHKEVTIKDGGVTHTRDDPRPRGSSLLLGWPEVGIGLQAGLGEYDVEEHRFDLVDWRGMRGARTWPTQVVAGRRYPWDGAEYGSWGRHWVPTEAIPERYGEAS